MRLASVAVKSEVGTVQQNMSTTVSWIKKLTEKGADFILFPELNLSGYTKEIDILENVLSQKETIFYQLKQTSTQNNAAFAVGFPEKIESNYFISHFLFYEGEVVGVHRKTHLGPSEKETFTKGDKIEVFKVGKLNIGMQLCYETHFPEISYIQEKKGANVLAMAFASPKETAEIKLNRFKRFIPARAYDNACFVVACNTQQEESCVKKTSKIPRESTRTFHGLSLIIDPKGKVIQETISEQKGYVLEDCSLEQIEAIKQSRMAYFNKEKRENLFIDYYQKPETKR